MHIQGQRDPMTRRELLRRAGTGVGMPGLAAVLMDADGITALLQDLKRLGLFDETLRSRTRSMCTTCTRPSSG